MKNFTILICSLFLYLTASSQENSIVKSNDKFIVKTVASNIKKINQSYGIKCNKKSIRWTGTSNTSNEISVEGEIESIDKCGTSVVKFELRLTPNETLDNSVSSTKSRLEMNTDKDLLSKHKYRTLGFYFPRCEDGSHTVNSYNLCWL